MNNREKARELQLDYVMNGCGDSTDIRCACEEMAEWKDQQFKEYLEKKIHTIESMKDIDTTLLTDTAVVRTIKEIINELLGETEEVDYSNNDE